MMLLSDESDVEHEHNGHEHSADDEHSADAHEHLHDVVPEQSKLIVTLERQNADEMQLTYSLQNLTYLGALQMIGTLIDCIVKDIQVPTENTIDAETHDAGS